MIKRQLFPHQEAAFKVMMQRNAVPLFWEMRLGKSLTTLRWLIAKGAKRILILCPKTVKVSWIEELEKENMHHLSLSSKHAEMIPALASLNELVVITNYETIVGEKGLEKQSWDAVICDESTRMKAMTSKTTKALLNEDNFPLNTDERKSPLEHQLRAVLSGTPAPENYLEYYPQFAFIYGGLGGYTDYWRFKNDNFYLDYVEGRKSPQYVPNERFIKAFANYLDKNAFVLSRKQVGIDLPNVYKRINVEMAPEWRARYDEYEQDWYLRFMNDLLQNAAQLEQRSLNQLETNYAFVAQNNLHQMSCGYPKSAPDFAAPHKLNILMELLQGELIKEKVVIWCRYTRDIKVIKDALDNIGRSYVTLAGSTTDRAVRKSLASFRGDSLTAICQIRKASMGMDLSAADTQIFFSRDWSNLNNRQARDRLVHPSKKNKASFSSLLTIDLVTVDTVDEDLADALVSKETQAEVYKMFLSSMKSRLTGAKEKTEL